MSIDYVNRSNDEEIIDIMRSIFNSGGFEVETVNEAILVKLMENRRTPVIVYKSCRNIDEDFNRWKNSKG